MPDKYERMAERAAASAGSTSDVVRDRAARIERHLENVGRISGRDPRTGKARNGRRSYRRGR